ncbi:MAG TPA: hypothetical protein VGI95_03040 [Caulobacteraceae bacterium]|jgi:hypothetical protein
MPNHVFRTAVAALTIMTPTLSLAATPMLTDADLVAYAAKPYDRAAMMEKQITLGVHHGARVLVDFPCSDICPQYTTQIIHYDVAAGAPCTAIGGVTVARNVPYSIAVIKKQFCVPRVLAGH